MDFLRIDKVHTGKFLHRYNMIFRNGAGKEKTYEIVSRNKNIKSIEDYQSSSADGVLMVMHNEDKSKILLIREYRMSLGKWIYTFPAGLIDPGETPEETAARELKEETGLVLKKIESVLNPSYNAIGYSNEQVISVIGIAAGTFAESTSPDEEIIPGWYTKKEVRELLDKEKFASRPQMYCYLWCKDN